MEFTTPSVKKLNDLLDVVQAQLVNSALALDYDVDLQTLEKTITYIREDVDGHAASVAKNVAKLDNKIRQEALFVRQNNLSATERLIDRLRNQYRNQALRFHESQDTEAAFPFAFKTAILGEIAYWPNAILECKSDQCSKTTTGMLDMISSNLKALQSANSKDNEFFSQIKQGYDRDRTKQTFKDILDFSTEDEPSL